MNTLVKAFRPLGSYASVFDSFFDEEQTLNGLLQAEGRSVPLANVVEEDALFKIELAAPGFGKEDFKINIEGLTLSISAQKENKSEEEDSKEVKFQIREFNYANFIRSFKLSKIIDTEQIEAIYDSGLLILTLPKKEESKPKVPRSITVA
ncbi:MAG: HSP20 family protein [Algoriphagus sp.]|jgi:HSP20 family protein